jgi:uncharacterized GH25 family protein
MKKYSLILSIACLTFLSAFHLAPEQILKTSLRFTILNELGNPVPDASVSLYLNQDDYRQEVNPVMETRTTDKKGRVKFSGLEPRVYFVHAVKDEMNNAGAGVQTDTLREGRINKVNIIIE